MGELCVACEVERREGDEQELLRALSILSVEANDAPISSS
jgi:hypothetical protein